MNLLHKLAVSTRHAQFDDYPWVDVSPGMEMRLVHARIEDSLTVTQLRAQPGARTGLHRHLGLVAGFTTKGAWSHNSQQFLYLPNSYICEPLGELHRFFNGPAVTEVYYLSMGDAEYFDDEGREVVSRSNVAEFIAYYLAKCEESGQPRPNVFR